MVLKIQDRQNHFISRTLFYQYELVNSNSKRMSVYVSYLFGHQPYLGEMYCDM
jgi:hypothetical protein